MKKQKSNGLSGIITLIIIGALIFVGYKGYGDYKRYNEAWKVEIITDKVNVRKSASAYDSKVTEVKKGKKYVVKDIYLEDNSFVWYNIEYKRGETGWIASNRNTPYVKEINNPNYDGTYVMDYKAPILKFFDDTYYTLNLKTINYNHLTVIEDSEYEIKHNVYFEEFPVDRKEHQYWIEYIVTDAFGNSTSKVQRIEFENEPNKNEVSDFSVLKTKRTN